MTVLLAIVLSLVASQTPASAPQATAPPTDPANSVFTAPATAGVLLVAIKPTATADYEAVVHQLQAAMAATTDPQRQRVAKGWMVFKALEGDAKGNTLYVHVVLPAEPGFDYRLSLLVDEMVQDLDPALLTKYRDAFAAPPTKLSLTELAKMSVAPVKPVK